MKKILIAITDMGMGGAQKSLLAFLQCLTASAEGKDYDIHLMVVDPSGAFLSQIPPQVKLIAPQKELRWLGSHLSKKLFKECFSWRGVIGECWWLLRKKLKLFDEKLNIQQRMWQCWHHLIPDWQEHYDIAISYIDGYPNYYVMDKVQADKKVLWIHNEYQKLGYDPEFDERFYTACNQIVTISEQCRQCVLQDFPQYEDKVCVLENITVSAAVIRQSDGLCEEFAHTAGLKLLSVGRLNAQKGYHLAIGAAKRLKDAGVDFLWLILGEGPERQNLQQLIDKFELSDRIRLLGERSNPYPYMKQCDILVQSSLFEGKSVVIDEAKMLCKPIVATNYTTVSASICHGESGWIVDIKEEAVFEGIMRLKEDGQLRQRIIQHLQQLPKGNEQELCEYVSVMLA